MVKNKQIQIILTFLLVIITLFVFSKNFYNEILLRYIENPNFFKEFFSDFYLVYAGSEILNNDLNPYKEWIEFHNSPFFNPPIVFYLFKMLHLIPICKNNN